MTKAHIEPGKPWQNGVNESFHARLRDECLNLEWFLDRREARILIEAFRRRYNEERPHSSLGYRTPAEYKRLQTTTKERPEAVVLSQ